MKEKKFIKKNIKSIIVKHALWEAYEKKCFYCGELIKSWENLEIDHIIPRSLKDKHEKFESLKKEFGLESDFEIDSYYNLVPTNSYCNKRKSNQIYNNKRLLFFLNLVEKKIEKIEQIEKKIIIERNKSNELSRLGINIENGLLNRKEILEFINKMPSEYLQEPLIISFICNIKNIKKKNSRIAKKESYELYKWLENSLISQLSSEIQGTYSKLDTNFQINDLFILKIAFWGLEFHQFENFKNPYWFIYEMKSFDDLYKISAKKYYEYSFKITRPIFKSKNWAQLNVIPSERITTEIIMKAVPKFEVEQRVYFINNQEVELKIDEITKSTIVRIRGKVLEPDYSPYIGKIKNFEPLPQKIPLLLMANINTILEQNHIEKKYFLSDVHSIPIKVNYFLKEKLVASSEYSIIKSNNKLKFNGTAYYIEKENKNKKKSINKDEHYWNSVGVKYGNNREYDQAETCFNKALMINPNYTRAWFNLGNLQMHKGNLTMAEPYYIKSLEIEVNNIDALINLGRIKIEQKNFKKAEEYLITAYKIDPNREPVNFFLAEVYFNQNKLIKAKNLFTRVKNLNPKNRVAVIRLERIDKILKKE